MGRPDDGEWVVLDESADPVPGDPHEVRTEATRLGKMAETIHSQITLLKEISGDHELVGKYADKLRDTADELRGGLRKVATRYEKVSGYLGHWADDLEQCQSDSLRALAKAQAVAAAAHPVPNLPQGHLLGPGPGPEPTPAQQQKDAAAKRAQHAAQEELNAAKQQLQRVKDHRDERAHHWMQLIEDTEHDGLKDSRWDGIKNAIHEHAEIIKLLSDICTWVVTGLVVASLFIPGLDVAGYVLGTLMFAALVGHTTVALTGDGSWIDVGFDVVALATFNTTRYLKIGLNRSTFFAKAVASALRDGSEVGIPNAVKEARNAFDLTEDVKVDLGRGFQSFASQYGRAVGTKFLHGGEKGVLENLRELHSLAAEFPDTRLFPHALARGESVLRAIRISNYTAMAVDQFGHWAGKSDMINWIGNGFAGGLAHPELEGDTAPSWNKFMRLKELTTHEVGR